MLNVPKCMSTQHPDNVFQPFFVENSLLGGEDEIQEAYYAFSHLGCDEQMWDFEGKEVDNFVVKKLLTSSENFFKSQKLGQDVFLTFRVPNPEVEKTEAKILLETLESIPRSYDAARAFYGEDLTPIFEVILPMTTSARSLQRIYQYYQKLVAGKEDIRLVEGDITLKDWIGEFRPKQINVIPLFENKESILNSAEIIKEYLKDKTVDYQRVFLARSDPAVNYGSLVAVLINKIALQRIHKLSGQTGVKIYPILGVGSAPFRGNLRPQTVDKLIAEGYPSVHTFTIQSSFKFDHPPEAVRAAIAKIKSQPMSAPLPVDEERTLEIIERFVDAYTVQLHKLASVVNHTARFVPQRRKRKLHIGLFGYSRQAGELRLPRAIAFTAALYSLGVPPEILGWQALSKDDLSFIKTIYPNLDYDMREALKFCNPSSPFLPAESKAVIKEHFPDLDFEVEHRRLTSQICQTVVENQGEDINLAVLSAARVRGFLG